MDKASLKRQTRAENGLKKVKKIRDDRRFKIGQPPTGKSNRQLKGLSGTAFPKSLKRYAGPEDGPILKEGKNQVKLGGTVMVGRLKGAAIFSMSLEERKTCPKSCSYWEGCYGNSMPFSVRWVHDGNLMKGIYDELKMHCSKYEKVLVRLHLLGDFPTLRYFHFWRSMLGVFDNLYIFGFTARWPDDDAIGREIRTLRERMPDRFAVRTSGLHAEWGSFGIDFPTEKKMIGGAVVCPEQVDSMNGGKAKKHCGNCAVCWETSHPIVFVEH